MGYQDKEYARGSAARYDFDNGSHVINFSININDDNIRKFADDKGWIKLVLGEKREKDQYGNTHSITINTYKPDRSRSKPSSETSIPFDGPDDSTPF